MLRRVRGKHPILDAPGDVGRPLPYPMGTHWLFTEQKQKGFWTKAVKYFAMGMNSDRSDGEISSILASPIGFLPHLISLFAQASTSGGIVTPKL